MILGSAGASLQTLAACRDGDIGIIRNYSAEDVAGSAAANFEFAACAPQKAAAMLTYFHATEDFTFGLTR